ncbi:discoidin domain-containing protein [Commensalibacter nepenthis]|uniref:Discoidin domain-containing protein n=1 Tax=Commensalibacter nepenthis TaxID=3043872 RepID=A0ABT6Q936_9PROT|nr:discoidin domain-containing protein [Commensalibacter sp. TBRC 10068]MDI2113427.1 discoidin domain-containing protein [Commensalibacter sp. TBRC 10068]
MSNTFYTNLIYEHELMLYPYAPLGILHNQGQWPSPKYNVSIISFASIEDLNIIEWLTYHQILGVDHIYLYCTDDDPTDLYRKIIAFTLGKHPFITFQHYRFSQSKNQIYFHFIHNYIHETTWYIHLENIDFLYINEKQSLSDFIKSFKNISAIHFNMVLYTNKEPNAAINISTIFEQNSPIDYPSIYTKLMVKSQSCPYQYIFRHLDKKFNHHIEDDKLVISSCNVLHQEMKEYYEDFPEKALQFMSSTTQDEITKTAYVAHFCTIHNDQKDVKNFSLLHTNNHIQNNSEPVTAPKHDDDGYSERNTHSLMLQFYNPNKYWQKNKKNISKNTILPLPPSDMLLLSSKKPCQQSSVAFKNKTTEEFAYVLTNGQLKGVTQSMTQQEKNPWWEIDLQDDHIIKNIYLFNGIDPYASNMKHFIIETSEDHDIWTTRHRKVTNDLFGGVDGSYYQWLHPLGVKARWIRIMVPGNNQIFSLDQIRILGLKCPKSSYFKKNNLFKDQYSQR